jgi:hypothetical protein
MGEVYQARPEENGDKKDEWWYGDDHDMGTRFAERDECRRRGFSIACCSEGRRQNPSTRERAESEPLESGGGRRSSQRKDALQDSKGGRNPRCGV